MIPLLIHVLHIAATCTSLGGLFYARMVVLPNLAFVPEAARDTYLKQMMRRFGVIKWTGVAVIAVTGIIQWLAIFPQVHDKYHYALAFLLKMIGATGLFSITFLLAWPNEKLKGMQRNRAFWAGLNIVCGLMILTGAALMRAIRQ
jgi:uncharacterized membrane protein